MAAMMDLRVERKVELALGSGEDVVRTNAKSKVAKSCETVVIVAA